MNRSKVSALQRTSVQLGQLSQSQGISHEVLHSHYRVYFYVLIQYHNQKIMAELEWEKHLALYPFFIFTFIKSFFIS